jgi:hypothetical protein
MRKINKILIKILYLIGAWGCLFVGGILIFIYKNNCNAEEVSCIVENIGEATVEYSSVGRTSINLPVTISYEENGEIETKDIVLEAGSDFSVAKLTEAKEKLINLKIGDEITLYKTIFGFSLSSLTDENIFIVFLFTFFAIIFIIISTMMVKKR